MKAEELKQQARCTPDVMVDFTLTKIEDHFVFTESELQQYAAEVSREKAKAAFYYGYDAQLSHRNFDEWWTKEQEEQ